MRSTAYYFNCESVKCYIFQFSIENNFTFRSFFLLVPPACILIVGRVVCGYKVEWVGLLCSGLVWANKQLMGIRRLKRRFHFKPPLLADMPFDMLLPSSRAPSSLLVVVLLALPPPYLKWKIDGQICLICLFFFPLRILERG